MIARLAVVVAAVAFALPAAAMAQASDAAPSAPPRDTGYIGARRVTLEVDDCAPAPDLPQQRLGAMINERFERGSVLHVQGDYRGAVSELVAGYCLLPALSTKLLKFIGQSYERLVEYEQAVAYYERYVVAMAGRTVDDATAEELAAISARIQVLRKLPSTITVATEPRGATVTIANDAGPVARQRDDQRLEVTAGSYTLRVERAGYEPEERPLEVGIGRPYSFSFRLRPKRGKLRVQTVPGDAKIFIDKLLVGLGSFQGDVTIGPHEVVVEARDYLDRAERVEVRAGETREVTIGLEPRPTSGKTQLVAAATVGGLVGGATLIGGTTDDALYGVAGGLGGLVVGGAGTYLLYDDIALGSSSYIITTGLLGIVQGNGLGTIFSPEGDARWGGALVGGAVGVGFAVATADRFRLSAGDAALYNSGAGWGLVTGLWFSQVFSADAQIAAAMRVGGTTLGTVGGVLLGRALDYSRRHVALIDLAGLAGMATGLALHSATVDSPEDAAVERDEQQAHFTLAGMAIGLAAGAFLTRNMDVPRLSGVRPQLTPTPGARGWMLSMGGEL